MLSSERTEFIPSRVRVLFKFSMFLSRNKKFQPRTGLRAPEKVMNLSEV